MEEPEPLAAFYFDLASPLAYLAAERVLHVLPGPAEWRPVLAGELAAHPPAPDPPAPSPPAARDGARSPRARAHGAEEPPAPDSPALRDRVEREARELGLQPLRWPRPFPFDSTLAMRAATYAASIGRAVPFAQAAFRQAFAGGHSLADADYVLIAAAACEMHPAAVLRGAQLRATRERLAQTTALAARAGVREVPAVLVPLRGVAGERVFDGERALERAAAAMSSSDDAGALAR